MLSRIFKAGMLLIAVGGPSMLVLAARGEEIVRRAMRVAPARFQDEIEELPPATEEVYAAVTLAELEQSAIAHNPTLFQAAARIDAARGRWLQAGLKPNPHAGYVGDDIGNEGADGKHGIVVSQEIVKKEKLYLGQMAAQQEVARAEQLYAAQQQRVLTDVRRRFYEALVAQRMVDAAGDLLRVGTEGVKTAQSLLDAREVARIDLLQAKVVLNTARIRIAQARAQQEEAWRRLEAAVGTPCLSPAGLVGDPAADLPDLDWNSSLAMLHQSSPELAAAYAEVDRARWQLDREIVDKQPNVTVEAGAHYDTFTNDTFASAGFSLPLPLWNKNQGNIARASADVAVAEMDVERVRLSLQNRLAQAYRRYDAARREYDLYDREILPDSRQSLEIVRGGYPTEFDYLKLITAQREYFQAELGRLETLNILLGEAALIEGMLLEGSLDAQP